MTTIISKSGIGVPLPEKLETAELAVDTTNGNLYTKLDDGSVAHLNDVGQGGGGTGSSVHIGDTPPANPQEGQQWMEVPANGDATMWIYDGDKWLQQPGGKDGAPGADGNIADATEQGVIATWDNTSQQWMPESGVVVDGSNVGIGTDSPSQALHLNKNSGGVYTQYQTGAEISYVGIGSDGATRIQCKNEIRLDCGPNYENRVTIDQNGRVDITGSLYVNGNPKIGTGELIETLHTLREATKDETTIKGLRDAIGNAVGGLIEKFEAMQSPATQEISDE